MKAGTLNPQRPTPVLVHAADRKQVFRASGRVDRWVDKPRRPPPKFRDDPDIL